jgi:large subunit ribosomal protein L11
MECIAKLNLRVLAGKASPTPSIASSLGPKGVNLMQFCKACNDLTKDLTPGELVRVIIKIFKDKTFTIKVRGRSSTDVIKSILNITKGSSAPGKEIINSISTIKLMEIVQESMKFMNTRNIDCAAKILEGKLKSMGISIDTGEKNG